MPFTRRVCQLKSCDSTSAFFWTFSEIRIQNYCHSLITSPTDQQFTLSFFYITVRVFRCFFFSVLSLPWLAIIGALTSLLISFGHLCVHNNNIDQNYPPSSDPLLTGLIPWQQYYAIAFGNSTFVEILRVLTVHGSCTPGRTQGPNASRESTHLLELCSM